MTWTNTPESSNLAGFGYDPSSQTLTVQFKNNSKYNYFNVPENVFNEMKNASSKGKFFNQNIKGVYSESKVA
jgi:hypothetical protein